jgi:hypothetical protein
MPLCLLWAGRSAERPYNSTGIFAQVYRYVRHSTRIERQQTEWAVLVGILKITRPVDFMSVYPDEESALSDTMTPIQKVVNHV